MPSNVVFLGSDLDDSAVYAQLVAYLKTFFASLGAYPARLGILDTEDGGLWAPMPWHPVGVLTGLTSGVAATLITQHEALSESQASGRITGKVLARNASVSQLRTFDFMWAAVPDGMGGLTISTFDAAVDGGLGLPAAIPSGTLTLAFDAVLSGDDLLIQVTATSSLTSLTHLEAEWHGQHFDYGSATVEA